MILLILLATIYSYISVKTSLTYSHEVNQRVNWDLAKTIVREIKPSFVGGEVNQDAVQKIISSAMAINPAVEVYLLDPQGKILSYVAPDKKIKQNKVSIDPIKEFIENPGDACVAGSDPRNLDKKKVFSAAPVLEDEVLTGYVYVILGSEEQESAMSSLAGSYILKVALRNMGITLLGALAIGLLAFWFLTQKLDLISNTLRRFKEGDLSARIDLKDNSELKEVANTFNEMADTIEMNIEELKGVEKLRRELIANVSHDLRTPIASIQGFLETLMLKKHEICDEKREHYMAIALQNTKKLQKLVNDLFELSKLEAKERKLNLEPMPVAELVQDIANKYRIIAKEKGISINTVLSKSLPLVEADVALIDRVLQNIIDNAIKFCSQGDVINIELNEDHDGVEVRVIDTGEGISKEDLPRVFDRYHKGGQIENKDGSGLGLAIAKKILQLHDSDINVESELRQGTTFSFKLPLYQTAS